MRNSASDAKAQGMDSAPGAESGAPRQRDPAARFDAAPDQAESERMAILNRLSARASTLPG